MEKMKQIEVINNRQSGYRRAGLVLTRGRNEFIELTIEQIRKLQADPALTVTIKSEVLNEDSDNHGSPNPNPAGNPPNTNPDDTDGEKENPGNPDTTGDQSGSKTPAAPQPPIELSQAVMVAVAEPDESVYFNKDRSPKIAKWREVTGDASLTKDAVITAIKEAKPKE